MGSGARRRGARPVLQGDRMKRTSARVFRAALAEARAGREHVAAATSPPAELPDDARYYLSPDRLAGFGVADGELIGLFSAERGRGAELVAAAIDAGASRLDCFGGYLVELYARHGFVETAREPNWTPGEPDVVYMERVTA